MRRHSFLQNRFMELCDWYTIWKASVQGLCRIIIFSLQLLRSLLCAKMCAILAKFDTFAHVDTHFSKMAAWIFKLCVPNHERPWSRDCAEEFFCIAVIARRVSRETLHNSETFTCVDTHFSEPLHGIMRLIYHMKGLSPGIVQKNYFLITVIAQPVMRKNVHNFG